MTLKHILLALAATLALAACGGNDYSPKPKAYLRIDLPQHEYMPVSTAADTAGTVYPLPFGFEKATASQLELKRHTSDSVWLDIEYPQWNGVVFLTYKRLHGLDDLRRQTDLSQRLLQDHYRFTSGIEEQQYKDPDAHVYCTTFRIRGTRVASTYQFLATDSVHHFLRGALYLNTVPNNDSLAPVLEHLQADLDHMVETLRWR